MIYLDSGATTYPKPQSVIQAVNMALKNYGANPGRSGHKLSLKASEEIYSCRVKIAKFFGVEREENVIFTSNCTHALNIVISGYLNPDDHVVISSLEHNSVVRPVEELKKIGVTYTQATVYPNDDDATVDSFRKALNAKTRLVICMHASNVFGVKLPVERITALCHQYDIKVLIDGAQSAGIFPINIKDVGVDFYATSGHKGLYGPMGTGILIVKDGSCLNSLSQGGTGSSSISFSQPEIMPDKFESGTPNLPGIAGLNKAIDFINNNKIENIALREMKLIERLYDKLNNMKNVILYTEKPTIENSAPVLSFNIKELDSEYVAAYLNKEYDIAVRAGLHCSPAAHIAMNTIDTGTVRITPSYFNTQRHIDTLLFALQKIKQ